MEFRHLRYFVAVAEELSFRRAAARLNVSQPPLSVQIRQLEDEVGTELFSRTPGRGITLTDSGRQFLEQARKTLANAELGVTLARRAANGETGHLSIGFLPAAEYRIFPHIVPAFRKKWPNVQLAFRSLNTSQQVEGVRRDELDVGFVWLPVPSKDLDVRELTRDPLVSVIPKSHRLALSKSVSIKDLSDEPLVLFPRQLYPDTYHRIERLFLNANSVMKVIYELESSPSVVNFVGMGCGCALLPDYTRGIWNDQVVYRPLQTPGIVTPLASIKRKGRHGLVDLFFRFTVETMRGLLVHEHPETAQRAF